MRYGWPNSFKESDEDVKEFWGLRDDISYIEGLVMAGSRIIVPLASRKQVLENIHEGHQGETKCMLRAKSAVYWPGVYKEIENIVKNCSACQEFANAQPKCSMISMEVPSQPWHTVGADLFKFKGKWHVLVTDFYSKAPFVRYVPNTGANATIKALKSIFAENGVPVKIVSDNGPHFAAAEYRNFARKWGFSFVLSSPEYPQGHALIERHVQTIKKCMYKCDVSGYDFDLAMLVLRSTPLDSELPSPAELLQQRKFRTTLPVHVPDPKLTKVIQERLREKQVKAASRYDMTAKEKPELTTGQNVRLYNKDTRRWEPARITGLASTPRSYHVQRMSGGKVLRRNRVHLKPTIEDWDNRQYYGTEDVVDQYDLPAQKEVSGRNPVPSVPHATQIPGSSGEPQTPVSTASPQIPASSQTPASTSSTAPLRRTARIMKQRDFYQAGSSK